MSQSTPPLGIRHTAGSGARGSLDRVPPQAFFLVSAIFHYLGPSLAVLLFARVSVLGVAWLRIAGAAVVFAAWRRPWRLFFPHRGGHRSSGRLDTASRRTLIALGVVLAVMNTAFYLAVDRLPLSTVGAIEFLGTVILAAAGTRTGRNAVALALTVAGVAAITSIRLAGQPFGFLFAFGNCLLFMLYVVLGHRIANGRPGSAAKQGSAASPDGAANPDGAGPPGGIDLLAASMLFAALAVTPIGLADALPTFTRPALLLAGLGVGVCSSVIPYVTDQLAMARLPRATFALMLALLPVFATIIGAIVLRQVPTLRDLVGIALVAVGVAIHTEGK